MNEVKEKEKIDPRGIYLKNLIAARGYKNIVHFSKVHNLPYTTVRDYTLRNDFGKTTVGMIVKICNALEVSPAFISGNFDTDTNAENMNNAQLLQLIEIQEAISIREQDLIKKELELNQKERELLLKEASLLGRKGR